MASGATREIDDITCGGVPEVAVLNETIVQEMVRGAVHRGVPMILAATEAIHAAQRFRHSVNAHTQRRDIFAPIRVAYLLGDFENDEMFSRALERQERNAHFQSDIAELLETFVFSGVDILQCFVHRQITCDETIHSLRELHAVTNEAMNAYGRCYDKKAARLSVDWKWTMPRLQRIQ